MLTRRELLKGFGIVAAGTALGTAITLIPKPTYEAPFNEEYGQLVIADRDGIIVPSKENYSLLVYGKALTKVEADLLGDVVGVTIYDPGWVVSIDRETLIANGVDWEPQTGDICPAPLFGVFVD